MKAYKTRLAELAATGASGTVIAKKLKAEKYDRSQASVVRDLKKLRGPRRVARRPQPAREPDVTAAAIEAAKDDPTTLETLLDVVTRQMTRAEGRNDSASLARFTGLGTQIFEAQRKAAPPQDRAGGVWISSAEATGSSLEVARKYAKLTVDVLAEIGEGATEPLATACPIEREIFAALVDALERGKAKC